MARNKNETLSIRTTAEIKRVLRQAAERERRSVTSILETLVMEYGKHHGLRQTAAVSIRKTN